jgi:CRP-like cAMP-binding protein
VPAHTLESIVAEIPLFAGMKPEHLALIAGCAKNVRFEPGEMIWRQGEPADQFFIVRQGRVAVEMHGAGHGVLTLHTVGENEVTGWAWLIPPYRWRFDARAVTATRALSLDGKCLRGKCEKDTDLGFHLMSRFATLIAERVQAMSLQLLDVYGERD